MKCIPFEYEMKFKTETIDIPLYNIFERIINRVLKLISLMDGILSF